MSEIGLYDAGAPHIEVRIYDRDRLIARELCESDADAEAVVDRWSQDGDFTFQVSDLSQDPGPDDVLGGEAVEPDDVRDADERAYPD